MYAIWAHQVKPIIRVTQEVEAERLNTRSARATEKFKTSLNNKAAFPASERKQEKGNIQLSGAGLAQHIGGPKLDVKDHNKQNKQITFAESESAV